MKYKLLFLLITIELILIIFLLVKIYKNRLNILGASVSISPIEKNNLIFSQDGELRNFYEFKPNTILSDSHSWLPSGYTFTNIINADGLNERFNYSINKPQDTFRIITLGDSFTQGAFVNTRENYPEQLEDLLNSKSVCSNIKKFEVINLGVGGYDIKYAVKRFEVRGQKYDPDLVMWFLKEDDFEQINDFIKPRADIILKQIKASGELEEYYKKGIFYPHYRQATEEQKKLGEDNMLDYQKRALHSIGKHYEGILVVFTFPHQPSKDYKGIILDFVQVRENAYFYDDLPNIYAIMGSNFIDGHPNAKGYLLIANNLFTYLTENKLITCN